MASVFGHVAAATALGYAFFPRQVRPATLVLAGFCAFAPDLDVLAFRFGVPYASQWGHRGWTHSVVFAVAFGSLMAWFFAKFDKIEDARRLLAWLVLATLSHPLLDMLTNGGRGVALWWPFDTVRIFFPFRPVQVSPISVADFFSPWGLEVLASEVLWIGFPALGLVGVAKLLRYKVGEG
jgi:inner membrane protein